jgi:uncharacterized protein YcbK (DUF882 family)
MQVSLMTHSVDGSRESQKTTPCLTRRGFLKLAAMSMGCLATYPALAKVTTKQERKLFFYCPKIDERVRTVYWTPQDGYLRDSIKEISRVLRDYRTDQVKLFDPKLLDQMFALQLKMDYRKPFHVFSGYRSPKTNAMLRRNSEAVAKNSFHMYGKAADISMPGRSVADLHRAALSLSAGGVGYYPRSHFVHIDSGPVRSWG